MEGEHSSRFSAAIRSECSRIAELLIVKRRQYGDATTGNFAARVVAALTDLSERDANALSYLYRLGEKMCRLEALLSSGEDDVDAAIDDTLLDIVGHALLIRIIRAEPESGYGD